MFTNSTASAPDVGAGLDALTPVQWRLLLAARGFHIFPLIPGNKRPAVRDWENRATSDTDAALDWPSDEHGVGIACGPSRLLVIDCDNHGGTPPEPWNVSGVTTGEDALAVLWDTLAPGTSPWAEALSVVTPSGGVHLYFQDPTGGKLRNSAGRLAWQVDTRASGGYVVAPGTRLPNGIYTAIHWPAALPVAPSWLVDRLTERPAPQRPARGLRGLHGAPAGRRTEGLARAVAQAPQGKRNDVLNWAGHKLAAEGLATPENVDRLAAAARAAGLEDREIGRTLQSALQSAEVAA